MQHGRYTNGFPPVALRKESVDRNSFCVAFIVLQRMSLSARRAWIEINGAHGCCSVVDVALRKESVDRNSTISATFKRDFESLSARRAWIEIILDIIPPTKGRRSLSARRAWIEITAFDAFLTAPASLSARRAWIEIF